MSEELMNFDIPQNRDCIIKVIGVGGGGSNAVNHMFNQGIKDVNFMVCNTDEQALENSPVPIKIQLGESLTEGRGAGNKPEKGKQAAIENIGEVEKVLQDNTKMVFITAGMGGGTGTGAAPIIAKAARDMGILTVGIVTIPFKFEGKLRINQALDGIAEMEKNVDSLLVINNEKLREMYGDLKLSNAFSKADDVLSTAARGIAEIITVHGYINVDFADVETVMKDSGVAIMGSSSAAGENRALLAIQQALESPLLNSNDIRGAQNILLNITSGVEEITMDEVGEVTDFVQETVGMSASIIWGTGSDKNLEDNVSVTIIATGFNTKNIAEFSQRNEPKVQRFALDDEEAKIGKDEEVLEFVDDEPQDLNQDEPEEGASRVIDFDAIEKAKDDRIHLFYKDTVQKKVVEESEMDMPLGYSQGRISTGVGERFSISPEDMEDDRYIERIENVPAYKRKKSKQLDASVEDDSRYKVSRFTISEGKDGKTKIVRDNPYLHDNVD
ncbi:cell division protein FtsZ [Saccharicrinis fermentans]|uniref:Cell division protein FtsZ n=1 Tax=Saccharicrinis fermentans DSM 9555 = JCM 21142 TaxID=869213 RepID=W7YDX5_9BACT|nr:cell division protein FtsZ [Saccharicrinis fermentans]GAF02661.1 cell division protein FtsZ [Saccharicrinis fermentans DSM 9555 = JCM 21142]